MLNIKSEKQARPISGSLAKALCGLDEARAAFAKVQKQIEHAPWIDYKLVWDDDAQEYFLKEWHDHLLDLGLNPVTQRGICLSLVFKWVNRIPGDD